MTPAELRSDVLVIACAISAGIHGALTPSHFDEGIGAGLGFAVATVGLTGIVVGLSRRPGSMLALAAAAATLAGLLASYGLSITTGVPVLHPHPEPVDSLALATKAIEVVGLLAATSLLRRRVAIIHSPKGALT